MNMQIRRWLIAALMCCLVAASSVGAPADRDARISPRNIEIGGEIGRRIDVTVQNNLLKIDVDGDFLRPFRERTEQSFVGLGMLIDSTVRLAAYTGSDEVIELKKHLVRETIATQEDSGYVGIYRPENRIRKLWDVHETAYIARGLTADYRLFNNERSLQAAKDLMDYVLRKWSANPDMLDPGLTVFMAVTGLEETLLEMYKVTGKERYLDFVVDFRELPQWDYPIVLGRWGDLGGHAYAYLHRCLAQLRLHEIRPDEGLLERSHNLMDFLRRGEGLLITGEVSKHECWTNNQDGSEGLGETCSTAYLLRFYDQLLRMKTDSLYGDLMERTIYNGLFAAQSPDGRKIRYHTPFDGERKYFGKDTYCCPNNYRRIISELPRMVYYRLDGGIAVNLYARSKADIELESGQEVTIRQETDYPNSGEVRITVDPSEPASFPLMLRIPRWGSEASVDMNADGVGADVRGGQFFRLRREWSPGDTVTLRMDMPLRLVRGREAQAGQVAVMRGPQVFCLSTDRNEELAGQELGDVTIDPDTLQGPIKDDSVRPGGLAVRAKVSKEVPGTFEGGGYEHDVVLTEFADPGGRHTYFYVVRMGRIGRRDELIPPE